MADQNVPPRRPRDDRGWDGRQHHTPDGYGDHTSSAPYGYDTPHPYQGGYSAQTDPREQYADGYAHAGQPAPARAGRSGSARRVSAARPRPVRPALDSPLWTMTTSRAARSAGARPWSRSVAPPPSWLAARRSP
ncbi:hypothetical protein GCM10027614_28990 [Micromonospora vulcania]